MDPVITNTPSQVYHIAPKRPTSDDLASAGPNDKTVENQRHDNMYGGRRWVVTDRASILRSHRKHRKREDKEMSRKSIYLLSYLSHKRNEKHIISFTHIQDASRCLNKSLFTLPSTPSTSSILPSLLQAMMKSS